MMQNAMNVRAAAVMQDRIFIAEDPVCLKTNAEDLPAARERAEPTLHGPDGEAMGDVSRYHWGGPGPERAPSQHTSVEIFRWPSEATRGRFYKSVRAFDQSSC